MYIVVVLAPFVTGRGCGGAGSMRIQEASVTMFHLRLNGKLAQYRLIASRGVGCVR